MKTNLIILCSAFNKDDLEIKIFLQKIKQKFGIPTEDIPILNNISQTSKENIDYLIFFEPRGGIKKITKLFNLHEKTKVFCAGPEGYFVPLKDGGESYEPEIDHPKNPHANDHFFVTQCQKNTTGNWYLLPFGYGQLHSNENGPIDSFGFRNANIFERIKNKNSYKIAFFGGSSVHGIECFETDTLPSQIKKLVSSANLKLNTDKEVDTFNFGMSAHTVFNQMTTFNIFFHDQIPDIVISVDGFNDCIFGQINDKYFIEMLKISYAPTFELWNSSLQNCINLKSYIDLNKEGTLKPQSHPEEILGAYLLRKKQFVNMVLKSGGFYIDVLQPIALGKSLKTDEIKSISRFYESTKNFSDIYRNLGFLYKKIKNINLVNDKNYFFVDGDSFFEQCSDWPEPVFSDIVHLTNFGNKKLAEIIFETLQKVI